MPKTHSYGASYPSGAIIGHDGEVANTPDSDAPRIEDTSRPGGADSAPPIDEAPAPDNVKPTKRTRSNR